MPKRTAKQSIVIHREGEARQTVSPGQVFDFTEEELAQIGSDAVTDVIVTKADDTTAGEGDKKESPAKGDKKEAPAKGGKKSEESL